MIPKHKEKEKAISLRREGLSYREILDKVPVAKSSLSLWLKSVGLSKSQKQRLTEKKLLAIQRGWERVRQNRIDKVKKIQVLAEKEVGQISKRELWLIGTMLYWAEGSKERANSIGQRVAFNNSDPLMIKLFVKWLKECCAIKNEDMKHDLYIHENSFNKVGVVKRYWEKVIGSKIDAVYFKKNKISKNRYNIGENYFGLVRINIKKSSHLNRKISGWVSGVCKNCRVV